MNAETTQTDAIHPILTKNYRWSNYSFIVNMICLTMFNSLIILLLIMHRAVDSNIDYKNWVIILVGIILELAFGFFAFLDTRKTNPKEMLFNSRMLNMPIFVLVIAITIAIFWTKPEVYPVVYGGICGGFAGYLAGGLAYGNFFIKVKDIVFRTVFGGWIGVLIGTIMGSVFAYIIDPFGGGVFGGIFMGFWGGAIVSGPIAVILMHFLRKNEKFTVIFTKIHNYGTIKEISENLKDYFESTEEEKLVLEDCKVFEQKEDSDVKIKSEKDITVWKKILRGLIFIVFLLNPWEVYQEEKRIEAFTQLFTIAAEMNSYTFEEGVITK